jgi:hypothetical protein
MTNYNSRRRSRHSYRQLMGGTNAEVAKEKFLKRSRSRRRHPNEDPTIVNPVMQQFGRHLDKNMYDGYPGFDSNVKNIIGLQGQYSRYLHVLDESISLIRRQKAYIVSAIEILVRIAPADKEEYITQLIKGINNLRVILGNYKEKNTSIIVNIQKQVTQFYRSLQNTDYFNMYRYENDYFELYINRIRILNRYDIYLEDVFAELTSSLANIKASFFIVSYKAHIRYMLTSMLAIVRESLVQVA